VQIRDAEGASLADDMTGHICIRGDNVTAGYYQEPELTGQVIDHAGWLDTGDLGYFHDQQLYITGRAKDIVFVSGQNVYPHDLEEILIGGDLAQRGKIAISSQSTDDLAEEQLLIFILHRGEAAELAETAKSMTRVLGVEAGVSVHAVVPVPRIPKTTSGKVQRFLLVEALHRGEYQPLLQGDPDELSDLPLTTVEPGEKPLPDGIGSPSADSPGSVQLSTAERLLAICNEQVEQRQIEPDDNLFELGISSLTLAQIHAAIEDTWPNLIDITDLFDYPTVRELAGYIDSRQSPG
jgi:acyl carrier protein